MTISIVVAAAENNAIGKNNALLWRLPADLKFFKELTTGHSIIMGRKTFESIGKPLPNRRSIVISRNKDLHIAGAEVVNSLEKAIELCKNEAEVFIVGGAEIYKQALAHADKIYLTRVHEVFEGDAFFPELNEKDWEVIHQKKSEADKTNVHNYSFITLQNKKK